VASLYPARFGTPRLIVRTLVATFGAILLILAAIFVVLTMETSSRVTQAVTDNLESTRRAFEALEQRRQRRTVIQATAIAESPGLAGVLGIPDAEHGLVLAASPALQKELDRLAGRLDIDALTLVAPDGTVIASAGQRRAAWGPEDQEEATYGAPPGTGNERIIKRPTGLFRSVTVPLTQHGTEIGKLLLATALDDAYAREMAALTRSHIAIMLDRELLGTTVGGQARQQLLTRGILLPESGVAGLGDEQFATRRVLSLGAVQFFALDSIDVSSHRATRNALQMLGVIAIGALLLGGVASLWLARTVAGPIDELSQQLLQMARVRDFSRQLPRRGSSREIDTLTDTFNELMSSLGNAEAQTELAYVGAIKALAAALDCRDPYTAGHSERVSALSVMIGRQLRLEAEQLEVLRLGALLHDIGKIGIRDNVLTKAGPLTAEEFEIIKTHPTLGAHILRQVPFLTRHLPIVELHHERPDGRGYPRGLLGHATPLLARIVHVADAFDAMTTARAYRPAQTVTHAIAELWRYAGSQFDAEVVEAFVAAWSAAPVGEGRETLAATGTDRAGALLQFPARTAEEARGTIEMRSSPASPPS
jgi:putative nucleotidyltransferase with HDIG domain